MHQAFDPIAAGTTTETYRVLAGRADAGLLILCDHAGNAFPPGYGTLGLAESQLERHIAYDIGAAEVSRQLSEALGIPAILTHYSRLLIDLNRGADDPTLIMRLSDGVIVPGNRWIEAAEREKRLELYYRPYHQAIEAALDHCIAAGVSPAILSVHSFTESWKGVSRPWHAGVLWDKDPRLARPLIEALEAENDLIVGDNEPYSGRLEGDTLWQHGTRRGLAHALIEIRQDLIRTRTGQTAWAERLARIMRGLVSRPELHFRFPPTPPLKPADERIPHPHMKAMSPSGANRPMQIDDNRKIELEAAAFRRLLEHLRARSDVQNIDLMALAGFCRNCLANWYQEAAETSGLKLTKAEAREIVYGMPYKDWQARYQREATPDQKAAYEKAKPQGH
jgi:predicted N-formylglutamate amidohydrolase